LAQTCRIDPRSIVTAMISACWAVQGSAPPKTPLQHYHRGAT
jgi:hypothetical protein